MSESAPEATAFSTQAGLLPGTNSAERQGFVAADKGRGINKAEELLARLRMNPEVHADQLAARHVAARFFPDLADDGFLGRFAGLDMAARLVDHDVAHRVLLDQQVTSIVFDDGRNRQVRWIHSARSYIPS